MCGICAAVSRHKNPIISFEILSKMIHKMDHRGPDDEGMMLIDNHQDYIPDDNNRNITGFLGFGHKRLSIIDTSKNGHQPMSYLDRYWIVFNGEIYNYIELKEILTGSGYTFSSQTDTEVIMASYDYWGDDCFNKFNGMWALIIYDSHAKKLVISRDRFGIKPLYYYIDDELILFASEIKALLANPRVIKEVNEDYLNEFIKFGALEYKKETAFKNIFRFAPASYSHINFDTVTLSLSASIIYWSPKSIPDNNVDVDSASVTYFNLLKDSVRLRLRSDVPIGSAFSGGLDSSSIVLLINENLKNEGKVHHQKTFSTVYNDSRAKYCDESEYIDEMARYLNVESYKIEPTAKEVKKRYLKMIYMMDTPQESSLMSYIFTYELMRSKGITVSIDGQGADELQGGYIFYLANVLSNLKPLAAIKAAFSYWKLGFSKPYILYGLFLNIICKIGLKKAWIKILRSKGKIYDPFITLNERLVIDLKRNLQNLLHYGDRGAMAYSIESRFPFLDYRLVEFWIKLPEHYKIFSGWTKYLARKTFSGRLPDNITWRSSKLGWAIPQDVWFRSELKDWVIDTLNSSSIIKKYHLPDYVKELDNERKNRKKLRQIIRLLNIALWYEVYFEMDENQLSTILKNES